METKDLFSYRLKSVEESGRFEGFASVYGNTDTDGDVIVKGAFKRTLDHRDEVPLLWQHKRDEPIGLGKLSDSDFGLKISGQLNLEVGKAREAYSLLKQGAVRGLSIGFEIPQGKSYIDQNRRHITEVKLHEVSVVTFAANSEARVTDVKEIDQKIDDLLRELKEGRRFSAATKQRIQQAITDLQALLAEAEAEMEPADSKSIDPELLHSMIHAWQQARQ